MKKLWDFNCDENLKKMFLQRQLNIADERLQKVVDDFFADFFVDEVIFNKNNYKYTISYPTYWLPSIESEFERVQFAQRYFSSPARLKIRNSEFGILKYYFPSNEKFRKKLALDIKNDFSNFQNYEIEALLNAIENQSFKKYLSGYKKEFQKPTFSIKKNIYLSGIMSNKFGYYGFFELMKLGYEDMLFLWWLL
ncbi:hypothetical protein M901_1955 [Bacteriovorax sp. DB6_IX]|nr:hypothetical protein M901_1955 [Bacteriovorax sp. DB6_IX]